MKLFWQCITLALSFVVIFFLQDSDYVIQVLGLFIAIYLIISMRKGGKGFLTMGGDGPIGIFLLNCVVFLLIFSTGGINSAVFFILYFISFGIAFVFEPIAVFVFITLAVLIFLPTALATDVTTNLLKIGSLALVSPLAYFFGREYKKTDLQDEKINALSERTKDAADIISEDIDDIILDEKANLKEKDMEKLNEILEETDDLRSETKISS